jgi:hypothetical protein
MTRGRTNGWERSTEKGEESNIFSRALVSQVKKGEMGGARSTNEEKRNAYRILVGKPVGKRPP